jgi:nicotinamidase-related amidase
MPTSNTQHKSTVVMLIIDVINHFEFPDRAHLLKQAMRVAPSIARLKTRARIPVVYVNDNFGRWRSDRRRRLQYCSRPNASDRQFVEMLSPDDETTSSLNPCTRLLSVSAGGTAARLWRVVINSCGNLQPTAVAFARHTTRTCANFAFIVPSDCCAARTSDDHRARSNIFER